MYEIFLVAPDGLSQSLGIMSEEDVHHNYRLFRASALKRGMTVEAFKNGIKVTLPGYCKCGEKLDLCELCQKCDYCECGHSFTEEGTCPFCDK